MGAITLASVLLLLPVQAKEVGEVGKVGEVDLLLDRLHDVHGFNSSRLWHFVVVGNGPLTSKERRQINSHAEDAVIVRFNDENNFEYDDATHVHVIRHPSWSSRKNGLEEWHISPFSDWVPSSAKVKSVVYEAQYGKDNEAPSDQMLFASTCWDWDSTCFMNQTKYGASTGAVVLSALNENLNVKNISVFGMNWNGNQDHIDFLHPKMVALMCTKCNVHATHTDDYGQGGTVMALSVLGSISIFGCLVFLYITDLEAMAAYRYIFVRQTSSSETEKSRSGSESSPAPPSQPQQQQQQPQQQQLPLLPG